jgi:aspartyl-tRNA(Asn)/glutamyl-tRNA(Gln) amidotransferase subunit B
MRGKEEAHDDRYFPAPDLMQVVVTGELLERVEAGLPELPEVRRVRFEDVLGLPAYDAALLTEERGVADYYEATLEALLVRRPDGDIPELAKAVSNFVMTDVLRILKERGIGIEALPVRPGRLAALIGLRLDDQVSSTGAQELFAALLDDGREPGVLAGELNLLQVSDAGALEPVVAQVLAGHPGQVALYLDGKDSLIGFFIGQVMRAFPGSPDPKLVRALLAERLAEMQP